MKRIAYSLLALIILSSCTKIIDIELNSALQQIVVEARITDTDEPPVVKLSRTTDYFSPEEPEKISGAIVTLSASTGEEETLEELSPGLYQANSIRGKNGITYTLRIEDGSDVYSATSELPERIELDSLVYEPSFFGFGQDTIPQFILTSWFSDPGDQANYYQFRLKKTPVDTIDQQAGPPRSRSQAILLNDVNFNGRSNSFNLNRIGYYYVGDTVDVEFISLESSTYRYFDQLNEISGGLMFSSSAPANPENNISNGAMGYFSAEAIDRKLVIIR